jgi:hypothetical protein
METVKAKIEVSGRLFIYRLNFLGSDPEKELEQIEEIIEEGGGMDCFANIFVVEKDNFVKIKIGDQIAFEGTVDELLNTNKISCDSYIMDDHQRHVFYNPLLGLEPPYGYEWEYVDPNDIASLSDAVEESYGSKSKFGWAFTDDQFINENWNTLVGDTELEKRVSTLEYGKYNLQGEMEIDPDEFDLNRLVWLRDRRMLEFSTNPDNYAFSKIIYNGFGEIELEIYDQDIKDIEVMQSWPTDE